MALLAFEMDELADYTPLGSCPKWRASLPVMRQFEQRAFALPTLDSFRNKLLQEALKTLTGS
jgi:hypothetical protein